ncbi:MAG: transposase [Spirochaetota bacterium]|jgi:transposase
MKYSVGFRNGVLKKVLPPENRQIKEVAKEYGITEQTIHNWMQQLKSGKLEIAAEESSPNFRSTAEKFRLVLESRSISVDTMGQWLREHGLHSEHLPIWEQEIAQVMAEKSDKAKENMSQLTKENKRLKKELARKEKALAEMAALLVLKKKADAIWGDKEDD